MLTLYGFLVIILYVTLMLFLLRYGLFVTAAAWAF